jgi:hypothetical protein
MSDLELCVFLTVGSVFYSCGPQLTTVRRQTADSIIHFSYSRCTKGQHHNTINSLFLVNCKVVQDIKTYSGTRGIAPRILILSTTSNDRSTSFHCLFTPRETTPVLINGRLYGPPPRCRSVISGEEKGVFSHRYSNPYSSSP